VASGTRVEDVVARGMAALAERDWATVRTLMAPDIVWEVPGRSPLAGVLVGVDAVIDRWRRAADAVAAAGDRPPRTVGVLRSDTGFAIVQRNAFFIGDTWREITAITLLDVVDGRLTRIQTFVSDQYAVDEYWSRLNLR